MNEINTLIITENKMTKKGSYKSLRVLYLAFHELAFYEIISFLWNFKFTSGVANHNYIR